MKNALVIALTACTSSQLTGYGYDAGSQTLAISFPGRSGEPDTVYHYYEFPATEFQKLEAAESKGKFFGAEIRGKYRYEKQPGADGIAYGLTLGQEPKYTTSSKDGRIVNRATGKPIPDSEPVFIFRAKDVNAVHALRAYVLLLEDDDHITAVEQRIKAFDDFAAAHPDLVKQPDTAAA